jgi:Flp pilus assembly protein TadG
MTRPVLREFRRGTGGASAVEFALVVIPLLMLLMGTIEFGRLLWTRQAMQSLALSAARCMGVLQTTCSNAGAYDSGNTTAYIVQSASALGVAITATNVVLNANTTCGGVADFSTVTIAYSFTSFVPMLIPGLANGIPLNTTACFPNQS